MLDAANSRPALEPASPSVPAATENKQHDDDDEKCRRIHTVSCGENPFLSV
jgi:hypothetical protein